MKTSSPLESASPPNQKADWVDIALISAYLLFALSWLAKKYTPHIFGGFAFQTSSAAATAILLCVTVFASLCRLATSKGKTGKNALNFFLAVASFAAMIFYYTSFSGMTNRLGTDLSSIRNDEALTVPGLLKKLGDENGKNPPRTIARQIYLQSGAKVPYRANAGFEMFEPSLEELEARESRITLQSEVSRAQSTLEHLGENLNLLVMIYAISFAIVFSVGGLFLLVTQRKIKKTNILEKERTTPVSTTSATPS
jgi:uncharacterized membrane protein